MDEYGYLADQEVMDKYLEFVGLFRFAGYEDLKAGSLTSRPLPDDIIMEIIKERKMPLMWDGDSLLKALQVEKDFMKLLLQHYERARKKFLIGTE